MNSLMYMLFVTILGAVSAQSQSPNCLSQRFEFNEKRTFAMGPETKNLDVSKYDWVIDYGAYNVVRNEKPGITLNLLRGAKAGVGARMSTTRYIKYGKITARMNAVAVPGRIFLTKES
jgi:hypothetical protein